MLSKTDFLVVLRVILCCGIINGGRKWVVRRLSISEYLNAHKSLWCNFSSFFLLFSFLP